MLENLSGGFFDSHCTGWAKKTGLFLKVDDFATVGGINARPMSKFSKFYLENEYISRMSVR